MSYVQDRKSRLRQQLARVQAQIASLNDSMDELSAQQVESYKFDSGEGSQQATRRKIAEIADLIDRLEAKEAHLINEINNMGLMSVAVRRKPLC